MKIHHHLCFILLSLLYCSKTLASSSSHSSSDSERTLSNPSPPLRLPTPDYLQDTATSSPSPSSGSTQFVPLRNFAQRPTRANRPNAYPHFAAKKTLTKDLYSLSAQLERSAAYLGKKPRYHGKTSLATQKPISMQLDKDALRKETARRQAVDVYLRKKKLRGMSAEARAAHSHGAAVPRKPASPPLSAFNGHPILGPSQYPRREAKHEFQAKDKQKQKSKVKLEKESQGGGEVVGGDQRESKATHKEKGKAKAAPGAEPRPKMRKLVHLG